MTISEAAKSVLADAGRPMTVQEIYDTMLAKNLYQFKAKNPKSVLSQTLRDRTPSGRHKGAPIFEIDAGNRFRLID